MLHSMIMPQQKRGKMPTICVPQPLRFIVIFREEERGIVCVRRILKKQPIHRFQKTLRFIRSGR
jgi:hypothetical protein